MSVEARESLEHKMEMAQSKKRLGLAGFRGRRLDWKKENMWEQDGHARLRNLSSDERETYCHAQTKKRRMRQNKQNERTAIIRDRHTILLYRAMEVPLQLIVRGQQRNRKMDQWASCDMRRNTETQLAELSQRNVAYPVRKTGDYEGESGSGRKVGDHDRRHQEFSNVDSSSWLLGRLQQRTRMQWLWSRDQSSRQGKTESQSANCSATVSKLGHGMATEIAGARDLTDVLNLLFDKEMNMQTVIDSK